MASSFARRLAVRTPVAVACAIAAAGCPSLRKAIVLTPLAVAAVMAATGCPSHPAGVKTPQASTTSTPAASSGSSPPVAPSILPAAANGATMQVTVTDAAGNLAGAQVAAFGPTLSQSISGSNGQVTMITLPIGSYTVRVDATGHVGATKVFSVTAPRQALSLTVQLTSATKTIPGKVEDSGGNPLGGARLAMGDAWAMSAADGTYELPVASPGVISVEKSGYAPTTTSGGTVELSLASPKIAFENAPFGGDDGAAAAAFSSLQAALTQAGWSVENQDDPAADVRVWAAPNSMGSVDPAEVDTYVRNGGKIVVMGDWGGAIHYRPDIANSLLIPLGVAIETDLVRQDSGNLGRPEWFSPTLGSGPAAQSVHAISVYGAASLQAATPMQVVAGIPSGGYRVQDVDAAAVGLVRQVGTGLVVALGDTNAWMNDSSNDVAQNDNLTFAKNLLMW